ncbi:YIP1 family protein [Priestia endophytica]|uniref:YIP1 family protein n=1 Tax=Priestia endophytica TaxID=135735 RepID=UPI003D2C036F
MPLMILLLFNVGLSPLFSRRFDYTSLGEAFLSIFGLGLVVGLIYTFVGSFLVKLFIKRLGGQGAIYKEHVQALLIGFFPCIPANLVAIIVVSITGALYFYPAEYISYYGTPTDTLLIFIATMLGLVLALWSLINWTVNISEIEKVRKWVALFVLIILPFVFIASFFVISYITFHIIQLFI